MIAPLCCDYFTTSLRHYVSVSYQPAGLGYVGALSLPGAVL